MRALVGRTLHGAETWSCNANPNCTSGPVRETSGRLPGLHPGAAAARPPGADRSGAEHAPLAGDQAVARLDGVISTLPDKPRHHVRETGREYRWPIATLM